MNGKVCHLIIDPGSCENMLLEDAICKLSLKAKAYLSPYQLAWPKQGFEIQVSTRALVPLSIGTTNKDNIYYNIVPMDDWHILLGRPWKFDRNVHKGKDNTQEFLLRGSKDCSLTFQRIN